MIVVLTILGAPYSKANSRRMVKFGDRMAVVKSKEALAYERSALQQIPSSARVRLEGPVKLTARIYYPNERPDLDESLLLDVLQDRYAKNPLSGERELVQRGVYRNDRQVREKHIYHCIDKANPRAEVAIETIVMQQEGLELRPMVEAGVPF